MLPRHSIRNLSRTELTHDSSGNTRPQSSQLAEPLWTGPGLKSGISVRELISTLQNKQKSAGGERTVAHSPKILAHEEKATTTMSRSDLLLFLSPNQANPDQFYFSYPPPFTAATMTKRLFDKTVGTTGA